MAGGTFTIVQPTLIAALVGGKSGPTFNEPGWYGSAPPSGNPDSSDAGILSALPANIFGYSVICQIAPDTGIVHFSIQLEFDQLTPIFQLNGNAPVSFAGLPAGFVITSALLTLTTVTALPGTLVCSYGFLAPFSQSLTIPFTVAGFATYQIAPSGSLAPLDFISNRIGLAFAIDSTGAGAPPAVLGAIVEGFILTGTYTIQASQFTLLNTSTPIYVGDKIKVITTPPIVIDHNDPNPPPGVLQGVQEIHFDYTDLNGVAQTVIIDQNSFSTYVIVQDSNNLWFYLPPGFGTFAGNVTITLVGDEVQFSGSVVLGTLQILYENATGIYSLMKNQTDDVLYFRAGFTTDIRLIMLSDESFQDEIDEESFFNMLPYPRKILAQTNFDEDLEGDYSDFFITSVLRIIVITKNVEIPSPFIKTAFLP